MIIDQSGYQGYGHSKEIDNYSGYIHVVFVYLMYLPIIELVALGWYLLFVYDLIPNNPQYVYVLADFSIIITLFFYTFITEAWSYYSSGPRMYRESMNQILEFANDFFSIINTMHSQTRMTVSKEKHFKTGSSKEMDW